MQPSAERAKSLTYTASGMLDATHCVTTYAPMVKRIAHHMLARLPASVQLDDLIQAGMIGLMEACSRFEESQGIQFEAYAGQRIRGAMLDELRQNDWLPRGTRKTLRDIEAAMHRVQQRMHRPATEREVAAEMKVPLEEYQQMLQDSKGYQLLHYDELSDGEDESYLERHVPDNRENPLERLQDKQFRTAVVAAIEKLPERERLMMGLYYEQDLNFREIAAILGVTESRICQIHSQAIARIRSQLRSW
jgi:RNA polymerase sigma factor for flagellar operon FliA